MLDLVVLILLKLYLNLGNLLDLTCVREVLLSVLVDVVLLLITSTKEEKKKKDVTQHGIQY